MRCVREKKNTLKKKAVDFPRRAVSRASCSFAVAAFGTIKLLLSDRATISRSIVKYVQARQQKRLLSMFVIDII